MMTANNNIFSQACFTSQTENDLPQAGLYFAFWTKNVQKVRTVALRERSVCELSCSCSRHPLCSILHYNPNLWENELHFINRRKERFWSILKHPAQPYFEVEMLQRDSPLLKQLSRNLEGFCFTVDVNFPLQVWKGRAVQEICEDNVAQR